MSKLTTTQCLFPDLFGKRFVARFDVDHGSSDGGAVLLKAADRRLGLVEGLTGCIVDRRDRHKVVHDVSELFGQRIFALACGYADCNDAARLAADPIHKALIDRDPIDGDDLGSQPTLSRFENSFGPRDLYRMSAALLDRVVRPTHFRPGLRLCGLQRRSAPGIRSDPQGADRSGSHRG